MKRLLIPAILLGFLMAAVSVSASEVVDAPVIVETQTLPTVDLDTPIEQDSLRSNTPTSDGFTGNNQIVYDSLKGQIEQVAAGQRDSAVFTVSLADLGFSTTEQYPESYFGLSGVYYWDEASQKYLRDNEKYNAAVSEMRSWLEVNTTLIFHSLHADLPYDLYWAGNSMTPQSCPIGCGYSYYPSTHETSTVFYFTGTDTFEEGLAYKFSFNVDTPYLASSSDPYSVNTSATASAASTVASTTSSIISAASTMSDYEKLVYYKERISQLTAYNTAALESGGPANYGSRCPWNVAWVFDNDLTTNVVCEGYAKAFKHLCDLTDFDSDIKCYTVSGDMDGGTGAGAHMWNVVRMPDGQNYLVDVTNCDEGTIGYPDLLFMAGMDSGNVNSYVVEGVSYTYDAETLSLYTSDELTLAGSDYEDVGVSLKTKSLSLSGDIGVNFKVAVPAQYVSNSYMTFSVHGRSTTIQTSNLTPDGDGNYVFTCYVTSIEMAETIQAVFTYGTESMSWEYSVADYVAAYDAVSGSYAQEITDLVHALADYGHHAQVFLSSYRDWTIGNQYAEMAGYTNTYSTSVVNETQTALQNYALNYTTNSDISAVNISLNLESQTSIYVYVTPVSGYTDSLTCTEGYAVERVGNRYKVVIPNIMAHQLGNTHTLHITTTSGESVVNVSALSYANSILTSTSMNTVAANKYFAVALYKYYQAATALN